MQNSKMFVVQCLCVSIAVPPTTKTPAKLHLKVRTRQALRIMQINWANLIKSIWPPPKKGENLTIIDQPIHLVI